MTNTLFALKIVVSMIPSVIMGILFQQKIKTLFSNNLILVGVMFFITALILYLTEDTKSKIKMVKF